MIFFAVDGDLPAGGATRETLIYMGRGSDRPGKHRAANLCRLGAGRNCARRLLVLVYLKWRWVIPDGHRSGFDCRFKSQDFEVIDHRSNCLGTKRCFLNHRLFVTGADASGEGNDSIGRVNADFFRAAVSLPSQLSQHPLFYLTIAHVCRVDAFLLGSIQAAQ